MRSEESNSFPSHETGTTLSELTQHYLNRRRHQRFKLETEIKVFSRTKGLRVGRTVDVSESGVSAIMKVEAIVGELVNLELNMPLGTLYALGVVRQRNAFRYGFEFLDPDSVKELIRRSCEGLDPCN